MEPIKGTSSMFARFERFAGALGAILMFALMMLTFLDVCGRNLFNRPLVGASELTELMLAGVVFFMLPKVALHNRHIVIDLVDSVSSPKVVSVLNTIAAIASAAFFFLIGWQLFVLGQKAMGYADATPSLHIPIGPVIYLLAILAVVNGIAHLLAIPGYFKKPEPTTESTEQLSFTV
jgi:TRAP-type C4-dicarboxylate transport system permease small subunit